MDVGAWPSELEDDVFCESEEWKFLLNLILEEEERGAVGRFLKCQDKKRALISRLMVRRCCAVALGLDHADVKIERTKGKKPFLTAEAKEKAKRKSFGNFNFNVSHEGRYVVLASEPRCVVGVDVAAPEQFRRRPSGKPVDLNKFFANMRGGVLAENEWHQIKNAQDQAKQFRYFWSCKEAFTKARGDGVAFGLGRADFAIRHNDDQNTFEASVSVDGHHLDQWRFFGTELDKGHIVTVARGPPNDIVDAYGDFKRTFSTHNDLDFPEVNPPFDTITIRDLVPPEQRHNYDTLVAAEGTQFL